MTPLEWMTNDPESAKAFIAADKAYDAAREAAKGLPLAEKIIAYREAKEARQAAYKAIMEPSPAAKIALSFMRTALNGEE